MKLGIPGNGWLDTGRAKRSTISAVITYIRRRPEQTREGVRRDSTDRFDQRQHLRGTVAIGTRLDF